MLFAASSENSREAFLRASSPALLTSMPTQSASVRYTQGGSEATVAALRFGDQPYTMYTMTHREKGLIGCAAGVCLVLVKLIQAGFYLDPGIPREEMWGGFLTAAAFVVITVIFTAFLDESNPRKLFLQGLAAPSLIVALAQPAMLSRPNDAEAKTIPELHAFSLIHTVHAQEGKPAMTPTDSFPVEILSKVQLKDLLAGGALRFIGRTPANPHAYIIGRTSDSNHARKLAAIYNDLLEAQPVRLLQLEGDDTIYLAIGEFGSQRDVSDEKTKTLQQLVLTGETWKGETWKYATHLINGQVVSLRTISQDAEIDGK